MASIILGRCPECGIGDYGVDSAVITIEGDDPVLVWSCPAGHPMRYPLTDAKFREWILGSDIRFDPDLILDLAQHPSTSDPEYVFPPILDGRHRSSGWVSRVRWMVQSWADRLPRSRSRPDC